MSEEQERREGAAAEAAEQKREVGFAEGEHVVLRPVLEADLPELAKLLAANPCDSKPQPWSLQRLKKRFEDKDDPGLWGKDERYFAVVRKTGGIVGFLREACEWKDGMYWNRLYIGEEHGDRDALGRDTVASYLAYKRKWHAPRRISFDVLRVEPGIGEWLSQAGFACEVTFELSMLYRGQPEALCVWAWLSDEVRSNLADDGPVAGEEV